MGPATTTTTATTTTRKKHGRDDQITRVFYILELLARQPRTSDQLARECGISVRSIARVMLRLARAAPVYKRQTPGGESRWALDVGEFVARFSHGQTHMPTQPVNEK